MPQSNQVTGGAFDNALWFAQTRPTIKVDDERMGHRQISGGGFRPFSFEAVLRDQNLFQTQPGDINGACNCSGDTEPPIEDEPPEPTETTTETATESSTTTDSGTSTETTTSTSTSTSTSTGTSTATSSGTTGGTDTSTIVDGSGTVTFTGTLTLGTETDATSTLETDSGPPV